MSGPQADCWALIPAAGVGRRVGAQVPKQYLALAGHPVIHHALQLFLSHPRIQAVVVVLDPGDGYWTAIPQAAHPRVRRVDGGAERCHSVLNGLDALAAEAAGGDWVLVHDAARPCLRVEDVDRLLQVLGDDPVGGLLAVPVHDTLKAAGPDGRVRTTVPRVGLWHAYTPQMFRLGLLRQAVRSALDGGHLVTDEASAVELLGLAPRLVEGRSDNIKITRPEDLALARFFLEQQGRPC